MPKKKTTQKDVPMFNEDALFTEIAKEHLRVETLVVRNRDSLDFYDVSVIGIKRALEAAFDAGKQQGYSDGFNEGFNEGAASFPPVQGYVRNLF